MLSRKFGRELANYFSGSPLNRLSFLRTDHAFLRSAFAHPSTAFMLLNDLAPLVADESHLAYATFQDVQPLTGPDPFQKTEDELKDDYNSEEAHPLILFLGVDEQNKLPHRNDGGKPFVYKQYKGNPYFAVDVTPKGKLADQANKVIATMKEQGLLMYTGSGARHMNLVAAEGAILPHPPHAMRSPLLTLCQRRCTGKHGTCWTGMRAIPFALNAASQHCQ
jgi:NAD+ diphosphatase